MLVQKLFPLCFLSVLFVLVSLPMLAQTQDYHSEISNRILHWESPLVDGKYIRSIKEWRRTRGSSDIRLASTHQYREDGLLSWAKFKDLFHEERYQVGYQKNGQLLFVEQHKDGDSTLFYFAFLDQRDVMEKRRGDNIWKTIFYKDENNQLLERKEFFYGPEVEGIYYQLHRRRVFNIDNEGIIRGEMKYEYFPDGSFKKDKILHHYDKESRNKSKIVYYRDGVPFESELFVYNDADQIRQMNRKSEINKDQYLRQETYHYRNGRLERKERKYFLTEQSNQASQIEQYIYDGDLLIYMRVSDTQGMIYESNFQYILE